jgi:hypothetical protein
MAGNEGPFGERSLQQGKQHQAARRMTHGIEFLSKGATIF